MIKIVINDAFTSCIVNDFKDFLQIHANIMIISHQLNVTSITKTTFNDSNYLTTSAKNVQIDN